MRFFQHTGVGCSATLLDGRQLLKYLIGLGQGSRGAPLSWIQLGLVIVNMLQGLDYGTICMDAITRNVIHMVGSMFVAKRYLYRLAWS
jgi:hypothetical protein